ncbi:hypothetical protein CCH79_00014328 [Gambusia affinis]|uniref:NXPE C-terminal domain-containing protein n=1 Tax=Gambusia affinis TaxID=33528 RepID=A0A315US49_GAMAF|nr:hypothetical protein CCH79_00014328 [Gambusia affinis]
MKDVATGTELRQGSTGSYCRYVPDHLSSLQTGSRLLYIYTCGPGGEARGEGAAGTARAARADPHHLILALQAHDLALLAVSDLAATDVLAAAAAALDLHARADLLDQPHVGRRFMIQHPPPRSPHSITRGSAGRGDAPAPPFALNPSPHCDAHSTRGHAFTSTPSLPSELALFPRDEAPTLLTAPRVTLVHPSEGEAVLERLTQEQPDRIHFRSCFFSRLGSVHEAFQCICINSSRRLCHYSDLSTVLSQFDYFYRSDFNFPWDFPGGGAWRSLAGTTVHQFNTITAISRCLKDKALHLYGDSTIRQWFEYLNQSLPGFKLVHIAASSVLFTSDLKEFDLQSSNQTGPHGPPVRFRILPISNLRYIANELDRVVGDAVVVIGIWSHFSTFPIEVYIRRLLNIRKAVVRLLSRSPDTLVIIRPANPKALTLYETLTNSDWYSLQRDKVLRAIFKRVKVKLVDAWEMSVAHHLPHSLHPQTPILKNMILRLLVTPCEKR